MFVSVVVLIVAFFLKGQCLQPHEGRQFYQRLCYNDLVPLYGVRGIAENVFPYVNGSLDAAAGLVNGAIEYPVLTGLFMWVTGLPVNDANQFYVVSAILLSPAALATSYLLARMTGWRALLWAAAPAVVLYAFHNWDLLVVGSAVAAIWCWSRRRPFAAGLWLGIAAAFKLYPAFFLAPLFFDELRRGGARRALGVVAAGVGAFAAVNLPFFLGGSEGWLATYQFHQTRGPNVDNIWALWFPSDTWLGDYGPLTPDRLNLVTGVLTAASFAGALAVGWWRGRREETYPFLQVCGALLAAFLLWNKVHSPQFTLWILPFFALLRVNVVWWALYAVVDAATYYGVFQWFYDQSLGLDLTTAKKSMIMGVWGRAVLLAVLVVVFLRSTGAAEPEESPAAEDEILSHPPATVPAT